MQEGSKAKILMFNGEGLDQNDVLAPLKSRSTGKVEMVRQEDLQKVLSQSTYDLFLMHVESLGHEEIQVLTNVRGTTPDLPVLIVSTELSADQTRLLLKHNVQDWLAKPVSADALDSAIIGAFRVKRIQDNSVHAVLSVVGGAGATTVAVSLADLFVSENKKNSNVALFDLDFSTGNCSYALDMVNEFNLGSVVSAPQRVDDEFIRLVQQKHRRGFYLYSFKKPGLNTEISSYELVLRMLDAVLLEHTHTILDIPYYETEWRDDVLSAVNTCTLVTELNLPALKHTLDMVKHVRKLRGETFPLNVIINKKSGQLFGSRISKKRLQSLLEGVPYYFLPEEKDILGEALDRGILPVEIRARNGFSRRLSKIFEKLQMAPKVTS
ncbi:hypothetical protein [Celeribacter sp. PS-C1]|uniref:hypothetical protein n=1 Tax=Celeribacter sp. PS-C1 TaxID=2820813 RepID=UPI001CA4B6D4|nr:hypothetical protein [Celeribacter sp. PS-C1]MBW6417795.1 hypothetical protein [Celeribacter sp. PS-C1]